MKIAVSGATGLVGSSLTPVLKAEGRDVWRLVRQGSTVGKDIFWNPDQGTIDAAALEGVGAVVHLAGENIASGRWTAARKERIRQSRVKGTELIANTLAKLQKPPKVLVSASAIGYYGDRGATILSEDSPPGSGFLSDVCRAWESATQPAADKGIRVVNIRIGIVLSTRGGALQKMLTPFRMGAGGKIGSGGQYMSWVSLQDLCRAISHVLQKDSLRGAVNAVAPSPVSNAEFTGALASVLHRPALIPVPAFAARLAFGEMADALLLASTRVIPSRLQASDFVFEDSEIRHTLERIVNGHA
jgi:uncharacterized protein (TIGR01777 family)